MSPYSQRAHEVARDLFAEIDSELQLVQGLPRPVKFHLDASDVVLSRVDAEEWVKQSVDEGFANVRYYVEYENGGEVMVNLAAFEDPDAQYFP
ncbi:MAG: hypothetical protein H0T54_09370 [Geodermatophilaceae bacterium]|nr:hypothetical protein [Geodermatophilaceae bacterium]